MIFVIKYNEHDYILSPEFSLATLYRSHKHLFCFKLLASESINTIQCSEHIKPRPAKQSTSTLHRTRLDYIAINATDLAPLYIFNFPLKYLIRTPITNHKGKWKIQWHTVHIFQSTTYLLPFRVAMLPNPLLSFLCYFTFFFLAQYIYFSRIGFPISSFHDHSSQEPRTIVQIWFCELNTESHIMAMSTSSLPI